jgi:hypothetical protein
MPSLILHLLHTKGGFRYPLIIRTKDVDVHLFHRAKCIQKRVNNADDAGDVYTPGDAQEHKAFNVSTYK